MNIIIIDNGTRFISELEKMASDEGKNQVEAMKFRAIDFSKIPDCDLIILSGGHSLAVVNHDAEYKDELKLIRESGKPILGICLGCELIAYAFESELEKLQEREKELVELEVLDPDSIASLFSKIKVHESHRWYIKELGTKLKALAKSKDGIEIIKHKDLPIYGLQFHPELDSAESAVLLKTLLNV